MVSEIPEDIRSKTYYHATCVEEAGEAILKDRYIRPRADPGKAFQSPIKGRVYVARTEQEAAIYAMGGILCPGPDVVRGFSTGRHGYVFLVDGQDFVDIQPDEDSVGDMMYDALNDTHVFKSLDSDQAFRAQLRGYTHYLTERQLWRAKDGEAIWLSHIGKRLLKHLPDWLKIDMIRRGANISHLGSLPVRGAYKFDRTKRQAIFTAENRLFRRAQVNVRSYRRRRQCRVKAHRRRR